jgi:hypothetical protein
MANNFQNFQLQNQAPNQQNNQAAQISNMMLPNFQQNPILFPQPIGNVYNLNTAADIANVPTSAGVSLGLCLNENILYIKALQNGAPALLAYRLGPIESNDIADDSKDNEKIKQILQSFENRFSSLEKQINNIKEKVGGNKIEWQI